MKLAFAPTAEIDFSLVVGFLFERNREAAAALSDRIFAALDRLADGELEGPAQTLVTGESVRSWPVPPVRVYYQRRAGSLYVLRIYHQAQPPIER